MPVDRHDLRASVRQRAGLVEDQRRDPGQRLERFRALDKHPEMRRARKPGHQCHWNGEDQRARRRHHQHRNRPDRIAREPPGGGCQRDGHGEEQQRVAVGQPRHRRLGFLRRLDQPDDPGIGAVCGPQCDPKIEGLARVGGAAHHVLPPRQPGGHRLAGQRGLVEHRAGALDGPVHGGDVALPDQQQIARRDVVERDFIQSALAMPRGGPGHAGQKIAHLSPGATLGEALEEGATGIHQRDDGRREGLAKQQRGRHRQRRDDVQPDFAFGKAAHDLDAERQ